MAFDQYHVAQIQCYKSVIKCVLHRPKYIGLIMFCIKHKISTAKALSKGTALRFSAPKVREKLQNFALVQFFT